MNDSFVTDRSDVQSPSRDSAVEELSTLRTPSRSAVGGSPRIATEIAAIVGVAKEPRQRCAGVEANSRLTARVGLALIVLLFFEGLTIPFIRPLLSWHIFFGLVLIPPVALKMGSTIWRFARYYLRDPRYRAAGPPHPILRALGPAVVASTVVLFASGVALWLAGPSDQFMSTVHKVSFVLWFGFLGLHVLSHVLRAVKLAAADARDAKAPKPTLRGSGIRRLALVFALLAGVSLGVLGRTVSSAWTSTHAPSHLARPSR